jgi:hypothetical protein
MNHWLSLLSIVVILFLTHCGGSLSNEQRQEMHEARSKQEIRKVSDAELMEETIQRGKALTQKAILVANDGDRLSKLARDNRATIRHVEVGAKNALEIEKQIIDAYVLSAMSGDLPENVQMIGEDSLMYTLPDTENLNGAVEIKGIWSITFAKKDIILSIGE